ncbi:MAG: bifunctional glutamate N-acetyltransferase/amino-acid acetyltransferase ArgJ [Dehalococcoidia bacterium]|nr:bifunctional glutamate N-acetyltransferase/amino-acid acetyltransferase ArgJ [Dehalococcoidia bacterium]
MFELILHGTVTSAKGFLAGAVHAGIKSSDSTDLAILYSQSPCVAAAVFTTNKVKAAPVILSQEHLSTAQAQAIAANSGCANACTGQQGAADALEMANLAAQKLNLEPEDVLIASTGVIGTPLPMDCIKGGIEQIKLRQNGGHAFARAIMTTDTTPKEIGARVSFEGKSFSIGGALKGSGMIHPDLATMLCFISTDARVDAAFLQASLRKAADISFNMATIDGDTSTNDSVFLLANGMAGNRIINFDNGEAFQEALNEVCIRLAMAMVRDGEGANRLMEVTVDGATTQVEARRAARTVAGATLVKTALHGGNPNWGRIAAALGRSGVEMALDKLDIYVNNTLVMKQGSPVFCNQEEMRITLLTRDTAIARICLNLGDGKATAWGCDLSEEYVTLNSEDIT